MKEKEKEYKQKQKKQKQKERWRCQANNTEKLEVILSCAQASTQAPTSDMQSTMSAPLWLLLNAAMVWTDSSATSCVAVCPIMSLQWGPQQSRHEYIKFDTLLGLRSMPSWQQQIIGCHACCRSGGHCSARAVGLFSPEV